MTRDALKRMAEPDVEGLRWSVYARALAPLVRVDYDDALQALSDAESPPSAGVQKYRRGQQREAIAQARINQAEIRKLLLLDDEDAD